MTMRIVVEVCANISDEKIAKLVDYANNSQTGIICAIWANLVVAMPPYDRDSHVKCRPYNGPSLYRADTQRRVAYRSLSA